MHIRIAQACDLPALLTLYEQARAFMRTAGNPTQWGSVYPAPERILADICGGNCRVFEENGTLLGVFSLFLGEDQAYVHMDEGAWRFDRPYGTIHRLAKTGSLPGFSRQCFDYCLTQCGYLRADTHRDNRPMQAALTRYGFRYCGIIRVGDGTERLAYDYLPEKENKL